jgi:hypothetical protein
LFLFSNQYNFLFKNDLYVGYSEPRHWKYYL